MRILLPFVVIALCVYYYLEMRPPPPPAPVAVAVVAPTPVPQKLFYHSPLDAPAMPANKHTGAGYYSTDQSSVWQGRTVADGTAPHSVSPGSYYSTQNSPASSSPR